jgi:Na+-driven multidrug efflux pump
MVYTIIYVGSHAQFHEMFDRDGKSVDSSYLNEPSISSAAISPEQRRFESHTPLVTILIFAIGPLMFNTGISFHDAVDFLWISSSFHSSALKVVGFASLVRFLCLSVAIYFSQACVSKVSGLLGEQRVRDAEIVVSDLFRIAILTMLIVPIAFFFITEPMMIFMGCTAAEALQGREYLTPILIAMPLITMFQLSCGFLQSEGRSVLCGIMQLSGFALNCGLFAPLMLKVAKVSLPYAGVSFAMSQSIVGLLLLVLIYRGKFNLKPHIRDWLGGFHKNAFHGMLIALPFLVNVLASALPPMILLKLVMSVANSQGHGDPVGIVFPVFIKLNSAINSVSLGLCQGFLGAGSYAYSSLNYDRYLALFKSVAILGWCYHIALMPLMVFRPEWPARIWISEPDQLDWAHRLIHIPYYTNSLIPLSVAIINFLLSMKKAIVSLVLTLIRGSLYIAYSYIIYHALAQTPEHLMYAYNADDVTLFLLGVACAVPQLVRLFREKRDRLPTSTSISSLMSFGDQVNA